MSLMFPGFRSEALVSSGDLADTTRTRIRNLHARLKTEICRSLGKIPPDEPTEAKAEKVLSAFLKALPAVRRLLWTDIDAAYEGDPAAKSYEEIILAYPCVLVISLQRIAHVLLPKDYVRLRLTGERATDVADASGTLLLDVAHRRWSEGLLQALGVPGVQRLLEVAEARRQRGVEHRRLQDAARDRR